MGRTDRDAWEPCVWQSEAKGVTGDMATKERPRTARASGVSEGGKVMSRQEQRRREAESARGRQGAALGTLARPPFVIAGVVVLLALGGAGAYLAFARNGGNPDQTAAPAAPVVPANQRGAGNGGNGHAPVSPIVAPGRTVDGVQCQASESVVYHIHIALTLYNHDKAVMVPQYVGIPFSKSIDESAQNSQNPNVCLYWLHTHDPSGIVHVESPTQKLYTLGQFLDVWRNTAATDATGGYQNQISVDGSFPQALQAANPRDIHAYVDGKPISTPYWTITFTPHKLVTLEIGTLQKPPLTHFDFPSGE